MKTKIKKAYAMPQSGAMEFKLMAVLMESGGGYDPGTGGSGGEQGGSGTEV